MYVKWLMCDRHACGFIRGEALAREVNKRFAPKHRVDVTSTVSLSDLYRTQVVVFQRFHQPDIFAWLRDCARNGARTVYDLDDDFFNVPEGYEPVLFYNKPKVRKVIEKFLQSVDLVTVSTAPLAREVAKHTERPVHVVGNALELKAWSKPPRRSPREVVVGWMASGSHVLDAPLVQGALERLLDAHPCVKVVTVGLVDQKVMPNLKRFKGRVDHLPWIPIHQLPHIMSTFDIGISPLQNNPFNDSKSGIKALQYWASQSAVVVSRSPAYGLVEDGVDGFLVDTPDEWFERLDRLVKDSALRESMGLEGRKKLVRQYDFKNCVLDWLSVFERVLN